MMMNRRSFVKSVLGLLGLAPVAGVMHLAGEIETVVEIHPEGKYVVLMPAGTSLDKMKLVADNLGEWWNTENCPFLVGDGGIKLVKVDSLPDVQKADRSPHRAT